MLRNPQRYIIWRSHCDGFSYNQHGLIHGRDQDSGTDKTRWTENEVKIYLDEFASRHNNVAWETRRTWQGTGDDLARESAATLSLLFAGGDQRLGLELFYEIHPSEVLAILFLCISHLLTLTFDTGICKLCRGSDHQDVSEANFVLPCRLCEKQFLALKPSGFRLWWFVFYGWIWECYHSAPFRMQARPSRVQNIVKRYPQKRGKHPENTAGFRAAPGIIFRGIHGSVQCGQWLYILCCSVCKELPNVHLWILLPVYCTCSNFRLGQVALAARMRKFAADFVCLLQDRAEWLSTVYFKSGCNFISQSGSISESGCMH